jgi:carboxyl-terminal processing protease
MNATNLYFKQFQEQLKNGLDIKLTSSKAVVKRYLMAEFARQLYGENYYYEIVPKEDAMIKEVLRDENGSIIRMWF